MDALLDVIVKELGSSFLTGYIYSRPCTKKKTLEITILRVTSKFLVMEIPWCLSNIS